MAIAHITLALLYIVTILGGMFTTRFQRRLMRIAVGIAATALVLSLVRSAIDGPEYLVHAGLWTLNVALAAGNLRWLMPRPTRA